MDSVLECPASGPVPAKHLARTILVPQSVSDIAQYAPDSLGRDLHQTYPDGRLWIWGIRSEDGGRWEALDADDKVLFYMKDTSQEAAFRLACRATYKLHSRGLANSLWASIENESSELCVFSHRTAPYIP